MAEDIGFRKMVRNVGSLSAYHRIGAHHGTMSNYLIGDGSWARCSLKNRNLGLKESDSPYRNLCLWLNPSTTEDLGIVKLGGVDHLPQQDHFQAKKEAPASKEEVGRATWTFLHSLAARFPDKPNRQQQRDAKELMAIISRLYPCKQCAQHFQEIVKCHPVQATSGVEFSQWMCNVHNIVNRSLGKQQFPCARTDARWGALQCSDGCDLHGRLSDD